MAEAPVVSTEERVRIVLSVLAGEVGVAEAARKAKVPARSTWATLAPSSPTLPRPRTRQLVDAGQT